MSDSLPPGRSRRNNELSPQSAANVTLSEDVLQVAHGLNLNVSNACERGLAEEDSRRHEAAWLAENRPAMEAWDTYFEQNGLSLAQYRQF